MQQTQTAVQQRKRNLQDYLLSKLRRSRMGATVFLVNGFQIRGEIRGFDSFVVVIYRDGKQQMVYKHGIVSAYGDFQMVPQVLTGEMSAAEDEPAPPDEAGGRGEIEKG